MKDIFETITVERVNTVAKKIKYYNFTDCCKSLLCNNISNMFE